MRLEPPMVSCTHHEVCVIDHEGQVGLLTSHTNTSNPQKAAILSTQQEEIIMRTSPTITVKGMLVFFLLWWQACVDFVLRLFFFFNLTKTLYVDQKKNKTRLEEGDILYAVSVGFELLFVTFSSSSYINGSSKMKLKTVLIAYLNVDLFIFNPCHVNAL